MKALRTFGTAALVVSCGLTACAPGPADHLATDQRVTFHRGSGGEPDTLDPHRNEETSGAAMLRDLFEGLVTADVDLNIVPGVAELWEISDDGKLYTFFLRDNARWSNGDTVTAHDFVAGLRRALDPATASTYAQLLVQIQNAGAVIRGDVPPEDLSVEALDDFTLQIALENPTPYFIQLLSLSTTYPLHQPTWAEHGDLYARPGTLVSNGAYRLREWVVNSHILMEKNEFYHDADNVQIEVVYYHNTEDIDGELRRYRAGELDYTYQIPVSQYRWINENLPGELHVEPFQSVYFYGFDVTEPPFDDVRLRQALTMAVDRNILTQQVTGVGEVPAYGLVPPGLPGYEQQSYGWSEWSDEERIAEAQRLYAAAGYSAERPLRAELRFNTSENHRRLAVAVASMWKTTLGAEIEIFNQEWKVMLQDRQNPALWDIMRYGWNGDYADAFTFLEIFQSDHGQNFTKISSARYDELVTTAAAENDPQRRFELMAEAEQEILNTYAIVPLYFYVTKHLVKPHVIGYRPNALNHDRSQHYRIERP